VICASYTVKTEEGSSIGMVLGEDISSAGPFVLKPVELYKKIDFACVGGVKVVNQVGVKCAP